jgi:hypothetical protein
LIILNFFTNSIATIDLNFLISTTINTSQFIFLICLPIIVPFQHQIPSKFNNSS